jgi:general secretion pathway protein N
MNRALTLAAGWLMLSLHAAAGATVAVSTDTLDAGIADETRLDGGTGARSSEPVTSVRVVALPPAPERPLSDNPLWAIPLTRLSGTRDRPIFSPSRRPPPPVVAVEPSAPPPPRRKEVRPPPLSLVGTIAGDDESFGIFLDQSTKQALRLKLGDNYQGWKLRAIRGREATMEMDQQAAILTLPPPGEHANQQVQVTPINNADGSTPQAELRRH